jgi:hypothetical protein
MPVLSDFNQNWIATNNFSKNTQYQITPKYVLWKPSCSGWTDGRTARHEKAGGRFLQQLCIRSLKIQNIMLLTVKNSLTV